MHISLMLLDNPSSNLGALHTQHLASPLAAILPTTLELVVASACSSSSNDHAPLLHLHQHDLHCIHVLQLVAREDVPCNITNAPFNEAPTCETCTSSKTLKTSSWDVDMAHVVHCLQTTGLTDEE